MIRSETKTAIYATDSLGYPSNTEIRAAFTRHNGKLGESGSVQWLFEQKGIIEIDSAGRDADEITAWTWPYGTRQHAAPASPNDAP